MKVSSEPVCSQGSRSHLAWLLISLDRVSRESISMGECMVCFTIWLKNVLLYSLQISYLIMFQVSLL